MLSCNFLQYGPSTKLPRINQASIQSKKEREKIECDFTFSFTRQGSVVKQAIRLFANCFPRISCKVEFIQPSNWLYFVPNLLVIQHLETLYLGRNNVRVVCERVKI